MASLLAGVPPNAKRMPNLSKRTGVERHMYGTHRICMAAGDVWLAKLAMQGYAAEPGTSSMGTHTELA